MCVRNCVFNVVAETIGVSAHFSDLHHFGSLFRIPAKQIQKFYEFLTCVSLSELKEDYSFETDFGVLRVSVIALDYISPEDYNKIVENSYVQVHND